MAVLVRAAVLTVLAALLVAPQASLAEDEASAGAAKAPSFEKTLTPRSDGSYDITLTMRAPAADEDQSSKANVIIVLDLSGSMDYPADRTGATQNAQGYYFGYNYNGQQYKRAYYRYNNQYYAEGEGPEADIHHPKAQLFTLDGDFGQTRNERKNNALYSFDDNSSRLDVAKEAIGQLAATLLAQNTSTAADNVELALVTFGGRAQDPTGWYQGTDASSFNSYVDSLHTYGATNWHEGLMKAVDLAKTKVDGDPTYVVFVSDGNPTYYMKDNGSPEGTWDDTNAAAVTRAYNAATAYVSENVKGTYHFYGVNALGTASRMSGLVESAGGSAESDYFEASNPVTLSSAFAEIAASIVNSLTYTSVTMGDALTSLTAASQVEGPVDMGSFTYTMDGSTWAGAPEASYSPESGVSWDLTKNGPILGGHTYAVSFRVWPSQGAYDLVAALNNGTKAWSDLDEAQKKQLVANANGTYALRTNPEGAFTTSYEQVETKTVQSDTEPSDTSYTWENNGDGTWTGTRNTKRNNETHPNPTPGTMDLVSSGMHVCKAWDDTLQARDLPAAVAMLVLQDGEGHRLLVLCEQNSWSDTLAIAPGVWDGRDNLTTGHEYSVSEDFKGVSWTDAEGVLGQLQGSWSDGGKTFTASSGGNSSTLTFTLESGEPGKAGATYSVTQDPGYNYDLDASPVKPMLNGETKDVTTDFVDAAHEYALLETGDAGVSYTVTNRLRSGLNLYKNVNAAEEGATAPADAVFTFDVKVELPFDPGETSADDDRIWYYVVDRATGAYVGESQSFAVGEQAQLTLAASQYIRLINLPAGSTYTIVEEEKAGYDNTAISGTERGGSAESATEITDGGTFAADITERKATGAIANGNTEYNVTYTNQYAIEPAKAQIPVTKNLSGLNGTLDIAGRYTFTLAAGTATYSHEVNDTVSSLPEGVTLDEDAGSVTVGGFTYAPVHSSDGSVWYQRVGTAVVDLGTSPMPAAVAGAQVTNPGAAGGTATFGEITFVSPGTYTYSVTESGTVDGVDNDPQANKTVTVQVSEVTTEEGAAKLVAQVIGADSTADAQTPNTTFTNTARPATVVLKKQVRGLFGNMGKKFAFKVAVNGAETTYELSDGDEQQISLQWYDKVTITETNADGYETTHTVDDGEAVEGATLTIEPISSDMTTVTFTNRRDGIVVTGVDGGMSPNVALPAVALALAVALSSFLYANVSNTET